MVIDDMLQTLGDEAKNVPEALPIEFVTGRTAPTSSFIYPQGWSSLSAALPEIPPAGKSRLLSLPGETLQQILGYLLDFEETVTETSEWDEFPMENYQSWADYCAEAPLSDDSAMLHSGYRVTATATFHLNVLRTCKHLHQQGSFVLYCKNKFVAVGGLRPGRHLPDTSSLMLTAISSTSTIPTWPLEVFRRRPIPGLPASFRSNTVVHFRFTSNGVRAGRAGFVFPARYLPQVTRALALVSVWIDRRSDPKQSRRFAIQCYINKRLHPHLLGPDPLTLERTLLKDVIEPLGKLWCSPIPVYYDDRDNDHRQLVAIEKRAIAKIRRYQNDSTEEAVARSLAAIATTLDDGESLVGANPVDICHMRGQFWEAKRLIYELVKDIGFRRLRPPTARGHLRAQLEIADAWASYRFADQYSTLLEDEVRGTGARHLRVQALRAQIALNDSYEGTQEWLCRTLLREAELSYMGGFRVEEISALLLHLAIKLTHQKDIQNAQKKRAAQEDIDSIPVASRFNVEITVDTVQRAWAFLSPTGLLMKRLPTVTDGILTRIMAANETDAWLQRYALLWLKRAERVDGDPEARRTLLSKLQGIRMVVEKRFGGKVAKRPFEAKELLDSALLTEERR